ncbi:hypothetical protein ABIE61_000347 [Marinobacterium sp. MBR-111]|uniref:hypothetical protein n=1 Tax=Marinobacterium sp. MBR-111 TaxID=3156463 RepID=UPI00339265A3
MNLRILKKLSKRAAPILKVLKSHGEIFIADDECYTSSTRHDQKHMERHAARYPTWGLRGARYYMPRHGLRHVALWQPSNVWPGTAMIGAKCGYEEPEWEEEDAWSALRSNVYSHFTDIIHTPSADDFGGYEFRRTRKLNSPTQILKAAQDIAIAKGMQS